MTKRIFFGFTAIAAILAIGLVVSRRYDEQQIETMRLLENCHVAFPEMRDRDYEQYLNEQYRFYVDGIDAQVESGDCAPGKVRVARWRKIYIGRQSDGG